MTEHPRRIAVPSRNPHNRAAHLVVERVCFAFHERLVLRDVSLTAAAGERVSLIGENGKGKSSLLKILADELSPQHGEITRSLDGHLGFLPQEPAFPVSASVEDVIAEATAYVYDLAEQMRIAETTIAAGQGDLTEALAAYAHLNDEFIRLGGWELEARVGEVMDRLGLDGIDRQQQAKALSGGERVRLMLAVFMLSEPAGLLMDEPTNHLDDRAANWLMQWLAQYNGPCIIASHERTLLNNVATTIIDLDGPSGRSTRYGGGYDEYLSTRRAAHEFWWREYREWSQSVAEARTTLHRTSEAESHFRERRDHNKLAYHAAGAGAQNAAARTIRSARQRLLDLLEQPVRRPPDPLRFSVPERRGIPEHLEAADAPILSAERLVVHNVLGDVNLTLSPGQLHVITGANGSGKSTLLAVLAGIRQPDNGTVVCAPGLSLGYLPQESTTFCGQLSLVDAFAERGKIPIDDAATALSRFGLFQVEDFRIPVAQLSVGQRRRLDIALLFTSRPQLLLLDEPTNHLSPAFVEDLVEAIDHFSGPVVIVTHDRTLRERYRDQLWELVDGRLRKQ